MHRVALYNIIGTSLWVAEAWQELEVDTPHNFGSITYYEGAWWGRIGTEHYRHSYYKKAYALILAKYPELAEFPRDMGYIYFFKCPQSGEVCSYYKDTCQMFCRVKSTVEEVSV